MRIKQLELIKYGKFDGEVLNFPAAEQDFHVIVGPNEAGKSTVRNAVLELLFGMQLRSPLAFVHDLNELRLGAALSSEGKDIAFHRARGRSSIRTPTDKILNDDFLSPYLGSATKEFFEQMFGLDHMRLVEGGQSILDASKDLGRVLFQSAAGIGSFGPVRESLDTRATELWTRRGSASEYAQAESRLDEASVELKSAQVRTKVWSEAKAALESVTQEIEVAKEEHSRLEQLRSKLERIRRTAPRLRILADKEQELAQLGHVIDLPPTAYADLAKGQSNLSSATRLLEERRKVLEQAERERLSITTDNEVLQLADDILALSEARATCTNHARDLVLRQAEVDRLLQEASEAASQLGWSNNEEVLRSNLPSTLALNTVTNLLRDHGALRQSRNHAREVAEEKQQDIVTLREQLKALPVSEVPDQLKLALSDAQTYKNSLFKQQSLKSNLEKANHQLEMALTALGRWQFTVDDLHDLKLPLRSVIATLQRQEQDLLNHTEIARDKLKQALTNEAQFLLDVKHFSEMNRVVTASDVRYARSERDGIWNNIKSGTIKLESGATAFDAAIRLADELVDSQLTTATEAVTLQTLRQKSELASAEVKRCQHALEEQEGKLTLFYDEWNSLTEEARLTGIRLAELPEWLDKRDAVLAQEAQVRQQSRELEAEETIYHRCMAALHEALITAHITVTNTNDLASLILAASNFSDSTSSAHSKRESLEQQLTNAERALKTLTNKANVASDAYKAWEEQWTTAISMAKLSAASTTIAQAEGAVTLANAVANKLMKADDVRINRIQAMQDDLDSVAAEASRISTLLNYHPQNHPDWFEVAKHLLSRLHAARLTDLSAKRSDDALRERRTKKEEAELEVADAESRIKPLLRLAGVETVDDALYIAERSDKRRQLQNDIDQAKSSLISDGDGLTLDAIKAEALEHDPESVISNLANTNHELASITDKLTSLLQLKVTNQQTFNAINGGANAATAEAKRQESLSAMSDAAEHYIETVTASRLLKWAIDRYRDQKQGPMLQRAGEIFSILTLGHFTKLVVDYELDPPALFAKRNNAKQVAVSGLSEGTRDQLFLSLRIAAIELHIQHAIALPFIADDLFINFDDERAKAGFKALRELSTRTQLIFLTHHTHLLPLIHDVFGPAVNIVSLNRELSAA